MKNAITGHYIAMLMFPWKNNLQGHSRNSDNEIQHYSKSVSLSFSSLQYQLWSYNLYSQECPSGRGSQPPFE